MIPSDTKVDVVSSHYRTLDAGYNEAFDVDVIFVNDIRTYTHSRPSGSGHGAGGMVGASAWLNALSYCGWSGAYTQWKLPIEHQPALLVDTLKTLDQLPLDKAVELSGHRPLPFATLDSPGV